MLNEPCEPCGPPLYQNVGLGSQIDRGSSAARQQMLQERMSVLSPHSRVVLRCRKGARQRLALKIVAEPVHVGQFIFLCLRHAVLTLPVE